MYSQLETYFCPTLYTKLTLPAQHLMLGRNTEHVFQSQENEVGEKTALPAATAAICIALCHTQEISTTDGRYPLTLSSVSRSEAFICIQLPP